MTSRRCLPFAIILLLASFMFNSNSTNRRSPRIAGQSADLHQAIFADSHIPHAPITITSNGDFSIQGWPGNGTKKNPYVIEGLTISDSQIGIEVANTSAYFEIRNCHLSSPVVTSNNGIVFNNVTNGIIKDSIIESYTNGVYFYESLECKLLNNSFIENSNDGVLLEMSMDCTLMGNTAYHNGWSGFSSRNSSHCLFSDNTAISSWYGYSIYQSSRIDLTHNIAGHNWYGFDIYESSECFISNNNLENNGISIRGNSVTHWLHELSQNTVNDRQVGYFKSLSNAIIDASQYGQIILANCSGITIENGLFIHASIGVQLGFSSNCILLNNTASDNLDAGFSLYASSGCVLASNNAEDNAHFGFYFYNSNSSVLINNAAKGNRFGYYMWSSTNSHLTTNLATSNEYGFWAAYSVGSTLDGNNATANNYGFYLHHSSDCTLKHNTAQYNGYGVYVLLSSSCTLISNTASSNAWNGFTLWASSSCTITRNTAAKNMIGISLGGNSASNLLYMNLIYDNTRFNAHDNGISNRWDNGTHGNYWGDYDGNSPYLIPGPAESVDNYPYALSDLFGEQILQLMVSLLYVVFAVIGVTAIVLWAKRRAR